MYAFDDVHNSIEYFRLNCFSTFPFEIQAAAQQKQQNAKKDDKWSSSTASSIWMWGNDQTMGNANVPMPSGNGNANYFWEDPSAPINKTIVSSKVQGNIQQNGTGKALAKSQTVSNMQSVVNSPKANVNASKPSAPISKTSSSGNVTAIVNSTSINNNKKVKGGNSNPKKG